MCSFSLGCGRDVPASFIQVLSAPPTGATIDIPVFSGSLTPAAVPGPIAGAGLPGLVFASAGLLAWWRRKRTAAGVAA